MKQIIQIHFHQSSHSHLLHATQSDIALRSNFHPSRHSVLQIAIFFKNFPPEHLNQQFFEERNVLLGIGRKMGF
jgi:hypothetical protein